MDEFIERRIITGLIVSADYIFKVRTFWEDSLIESPELRKVARWCLDHYEQYQRPPDRDIESIFLEQARLGRIGKSEAEFIETILTRIAEDYERGDQFNSAYLYDQTVTYFRQRALQAHAEALQTAAERGELESGEVLAQSFHTKAWARSRGLELNTEEGYLALQSAFDRASKPVIGYPGALGQMMNSHLVRDGFVAFMGPEKRGKTWLLQDLAFRGLRQKANVAFFSAGDLTEAQNLRRIGVALARRSDDPRYCQPYWRPVGDCLLNQFDQCSRSDRNCTFGVYEGDPAALPREEYEGFDALVSAAKDNPRYKPCDSATCPNRLGTVWLVHEPEKEVLSGKRAVQRTQQFFQKWKRRFKLACYPSDTLTCDEIRDCLHEWERTDDFVPDVVVVDYADIMNERVNEYRHRQNAIWLGLRRISQEKHCLVITATQTDADSYGRDVLTRKNFSEDKRKYAHVSAMWGLNQDTKDREKDLGMMRINEIVIREGVFKSENSVVVLQDLRSGRPYCESYWYVAKPSLPNGRAKK